jgi:activating signal cointegrator 1
MKALTLYQPWATLISIGAKKIETRSWSTNYRGPLAIHAGKKLPNIDPHFLREPFHSCLLGHEIPFGFVVATCELVDVERIYADSYIPGKPELMFGDYTIGRYMWKLEHVKILPGPIPAKGAMGLWEWEEVKA